MGVSGSGSSLGIRAPPLLGRRDGTSACCQVDLCARCAGHTFELVGPALVESDAGPRDEVGNRLSDTNLRWGSVTRT